MQIVIEIPKEAYKLLQREGVDWLGAEHILDAVANGTPLPEHHRLIEADRLKEELDYYIREAGWSDDHNEALTRCKEFIDHVPTIIPATEEKQIEKNCDNCKRNCRIFPSDGVCNHPDLYEPKQIATKEDE